MVCASLENEVLEQTETEDVLLRQSKMGKFIGGNWLKLESPTRQKP